jgi:hypothetical protein
VVKIGFIVEGNTEKIVIESESFKQWTTQQGIEIYHPVLDAKGGGNLLPKHIQPLVQRLKDADYIVILTDLEYEASPQAVRDRIGTSYTSLIFIAVKAIEAWFLADSEALRKWLKTDDIFEVYPERTVNMPWERLKELANNYKQIGTGSSKPAFAKRMTKHYYFSLERAASHPNCPSAKEFHDSLLKLSLDRNIEESN